MDQKENGQGRDRVDLRIGKIIDSMPSLPVTVAKILEITRDPSSTPNDLAQVINYDPVLLGKVLKLVNSAYYHLSNQVTSIVKAIIMLGLNTIKNLALSTAVLGTMTKKENFVALNMDGYWRHSLAVAVTAKLIAAAGGVDTKLRDEYFVAGLLHDIGKIILNQSFSQLYFQAIQEADMEMAPLWRKEREVLKISHARVGRLVAEKWQLSPSLIEAIELHHDPLSCSEESRRVVAAVAAANYFCVTNDIGFSGDRAAEPLPEQIWQLLGVSEDRLYDLQDKIEAEIEKAMVFLQISGGA